MIRIALLLLAGALQAQDAKAPPRQDIAIVGARIETGTRTIDHGTVLVHDGKISQVTDGGEPPAGYTVVKADGMTVYPGFIDAYRTRDLKEPAAATDSTRPGTTDSAPATMWLGNRKGGNPAWRAATELSFDGDRDAYKSGITTALLCSPRGNIRGVSAVVDLLPSSVKDRVIVPDYAMTLSFRGSFGAGYPGNILGVIAQMRQTLNDALSLCKGTDLTDGREDPYWMAGLKALCPLVLGKQSAVFEANTEREIQRAYRIADEFGFKTVLFGGRDAYQSIPSISQHGNGLILGTGLSDEPSVKPVDPKAPAEDQTPTAYLQEQHDRWEKQRHCAAALADAGVKFAFGSEGGSDNMLADVRKLVKGGLSKDGALRALTVDAAEMLGLAERRGTIEAGKDADLVLMSGDFSDEKSEVKKVWIDGRLVFEAKAADK